MKFKFDYKVTWTWHAPRSRYCYTETKWFDTELEQNKFLLDLFHRRNEGEFVLVEVEASEIKSWKNY